MFGKSLPSRNNMEKFDEFLMWQAGLFDPEGSENDEG